MLNQRQVTTSHDNASQEIVVPGKSLAKAVDRNVYISSYISRKGRSDFLCDSVNRGLTLVKLIYSITFNRYILQVLHGS